MKAFLFVLATFFSLNGHAARVPDSSLQFLDRCRQLRSGCEEQLFLELSKTYRPSKEEGALRDYIREIVKVSSTNFWKQTLPMQQDAIGNLLVTLPATGKYAGRRDVAPFALQSHMDMVLAWAKAKPGEDIRQYFRDGVEVELKDGWYQAKDNQSTLGSDNGIGVAIALRYLIDPSLEHPPLELIFTVQEETGLTGAFQSQLAIQSKKMICLDGMTPEEGYIIAGSQGAIKNTLVVADSGTILLSSSDYALMRISVTGLAGGHSGGDIYRGRLNAIKAFAEAIQFVRQDSPYPIFIKSVVAGDNGIVNKIPNLFQAEVMILRKAATADLQMRLTAMLKVLAQKNPDDAKNAQIEVKVEDLAQTQSPAFNWLFTDLLVQNLLEMPNGIVDTDSRFEHGVLTSSNLGFVTASVDSARQSVFNLGYFTRGFEWPKMKAVADKINSGLTLPISTSKTAITDSLAYLPWMEPETSGLLQSVLSSGVFSKKYYLNAGLEPSAFRDKIPGLEVVALGPLTLEAHSTRERLKQSSIQPVVLGIQTILKSQ